MSYEYAFNTFCYRFRANTQSMSLFHIQQEEYVCVCICVQANETQPRSWIKIEKSKNRPKENTFRVNSRS